jgi:hypothetical protein
MLKYFKIIVTSCSLFVLNSYAQPVWVLIDYSPESKASFYVDRASIDNRNEKVFAVTKYIFEDLGFTGQKSELLDCRKREILMLTYFLSHKSGSEKNLTPSNESISYVPKNDSTASKLFDYICQYSK